MLQHPSTDVKPYLAAYETSRRNGAAQEPLWLRAHREAAIVRFSDLGFPTARRGNEEWKYTNVAPIARTSFESPPMSVAPDLRATDVEPFTIYGLHGPRLVFLDGCYVPELSTPSERSQDVSVISLGQALTAKPDLVEKSLAHYAGYQDDAFTALNTALHHDGAVVHLPGGYQQEEPIQLLFLSGTAGAPVASHPRVLVLAEDESSATVIESYAGLSEGQYLTNAITEIRVGPGALLRHYRVQRQSLNAFHIATTHVEQDRDSTFFSVTMDVGGMLARSSLNVRMGGQGSSCHLNGLYLTAGNQHVDNQVMLDHASPYTSSREMYKGVLDGSSRAVFHGSILVRPGAQKVDAQQTDKNLLLSHQAEVDTKPALWIYADDVKCGHGAASGTMDEEALFYLRSRGLDESAARRLLVRGFVGEVISAIEGELFRAYAEELAMGRLQGV